MVRVDPSRTPRSPSVEAIRNTTEQTDLTGVVVQSARLLFDGAATAGQKITEMPVFRPTFDRRIPHRLAQEVIRSRLLPLISDIAVQKVDLRKQRTRDLPEQLDAIIDRARELVEHTGDAKSLFAGVFDLSNSLESFLRSIDYVTFGQVGLIGQLQALSVMLRTSQAMWTGVRAGYAFRDPTLQRQGMRTLSRAEAVFNQASHGLDINADLDRLETDYVALVRGMRESIGDDLGLPDAHAFVTARRAWRFRQRLEAEVLRIDDTRTGPLSNTELYEHMRTRGVPTQLLVEEIDEHVLPALIRVVTRAKNQRGDLPKKIEARARLLETQMRRLRNTKHLDIDTAEREIIGAQKEIGLLLTDVEALVQPADGLVRKLRVANDAMTGLRGLFVTLRVVEALEDPALSEETQAIVRRAHALVNGAVGIDELPDALTALEDRIDALDADLRSRLHIEKTPAIAELHRALGAVRRVVRLRVAGSAALNPPIRDAIGALRDPSLSAAERGPIFDEAMKEPLLDTTVGLAVALRELDLGFTFGDVGRSLEHMLRGDTSEEIGAMVAKSPLAFLANAEFEKALSRFDAFVDNIDTPEGRGFVDRSLDILRAVYEVERDQIAHFAAVVPKEHEVRVASAIGEYTVRSSMILIQWISAQLADPGGEAVADFLDLMVDTSNANLEAFAPTLDAEKFGRADVRNARVRLTDDAKNQIRHAGAQHIGDLGTRLTDGPGGPYADRLRAERKKLEDALHVVHAKPEAKEALHHVLADLNATVKMAVNLVQLFGAASNSMMNEAERERVIQTSVERMGPMFIKVMQSLVNMEGLIRSASPDALSPDADPVIRSLAKLQDEVSPVPWPAIEERIRTSLELEPGALIEDRGTERGHFVSIEKQALKSGSIGQIHRARIRVFEDGEERIVECVVKVLRPGVEEAFENTVRATRLTLSLVSELLRLDRDGDIFGDIKADAEQRLPLIERALHGFIESFRVETDFSIEVQNLRAFEKMFRGDMNVVVPEVFDSHTKNGVLTMQELKGFKLSKWTKRYDRAANAPRLAETRGRIRGKDRQAIACDRAASWANQTLGLDDVSTTVHSANRRAVDVTVQGVDADGRRVTERLKIHTRSGAIKPHGFARGPSRAAAEHKARLFATRAFGLQTTGVTSLEVDDGVRCRVTFGDDLHKSVEVFVARPSGEVTTNATIPALGARGAEALRDRLRTTFLVQLIKGMLHGDPHEGNFFVMPDGKTIGLIDFGLALDIGLLDARGPLALLAGAVLQSPRQMADAVLDLSTARDLEGDKREEVLAPLVKFFRTLQTEANQKERETKKRRGPFGAMKRRFSAAMNVVGRALEAIQGAGLIPLPRVLHGLKAVFAMSGNIAKLEPFDERKPSLGRKLGLLSKSWLTRAISPFMGKRRVEAKRRHLERISEIDSPPFVVPRRTPVDNGIDRPRVQARSA